MAIISFIGDIGLNDGYIDLRKQNIDPFSDIKSCFNKSDLVVGNLECVLKGEKGENLLKRPRISSTTETFQYVKSFNLGLASLATNHVYDNLMDGFEKTMDFLNMNNISSIGAGKDPEIAGKASIFKSGDLSLCFLNYITPDTNPSLPKDSGLFLNEFNLEKCLKDLRDNADHDYRIVLLHWGGRFEGGLYPDYDQIAIAKKIIDHGADLIIGHHSHTLQPYERYKKKYIFYSIGNFCFSDIKFENTVRKMSSLRERESVIVNAEFTKTGYTIHLVPFRNEKLFLKFRRSVSIKLAFRNLYWQIIKFKPFWSFYKYFFNKVRPLLKQVLRKDKNRNLLQRIFDYIVRNSKYPQ